ncbi:MAG: metallophosphoesterase [Deltaproteobacteria bacterium]|nr:metallophosphoesterase [Deltaproteobacteria bacterium]
MLGVHFYLWTRLVRDTALPLGWRRVLTIALGTLMFGLASFFLLRRSLPLETGRVVLFPIYVWMGMMFLIFVMLLSGDLLRLVFKIATALRNDGPMDSSRRLFISRTIAGAVTTSAIGLTTLASRSALALSNVVVEKVTVPLQRLPEALDGFRIVQLSDLHIGPTLDKHWLEGIVARVNALKPDLVAITGDLVDGSVEELGGEVAALAQLKAPHGVYFCTGNHEYYSGVGDWCTHLPKLGVRVLRNERVSIERGSATFDLAGVDDFNARGMALGHGPALSRALEERDTSRELILLAHQPRQIFEAAKAGVGLQLSGHTHGGQIWPWHYLVRLQQPYVAGLIDHEGTQLYISQGTGFWGPPLRLGTRAEITEITLRSGPKK